MEKWSVLRLLNSGEIPAFKMGKLWKVCKQDLIQYALKKKVQDAITQLQEALM